MEETIVYKLIKLELKKNKIRPYLHAMGIITLCVLGFLYTFAMIAYVGGDTDSAEFSNYHNIWVITNVLQMSAYAILSAVLFSTFVIKEYSGKNAILIFTYPINRKTLLNSKIVLIATLCLSSMLLGTIISLLIFTMTEAVFPMISDSFTIGLFFKIIIETILCAVFSLFIGVISASIGFRKYSIQTTIIVSVILASCTANIVTTMIHTYIPFIIVWIVAAVLAGLSYLWLISKVEDIEV